MTIASKRRLHGISQVLGMTAIVTAGGLLTFTQTAEAEQARRCCYDYADVCTYAYQSYCCDFTNSTIVCGCTYFTVYCNS